MINNNVFLRKLLIVVLSFFLGINVVILPVNAVERENEYEEAYAFNEEVNENT